MSLEMACQQLDYNNWIDAPRINAPNFNVQMPESVQMGSKTIIAGLIDTIQQKARMGSHPSRILAYNVLSENGWNNNHFASILNKGSIIVASLYENGEVNSINDAVMKVAEPLVNLFTYRVCQGMGEVHHIVGNLFTPEREQEMKDIEVMVNQTIQGYKQNHQRGMMGGMGNRQGMMGGMGGQQPMMGGMGGQQRMMNNQRNMVTPGRSDLVTLNNSPGSWVNPQAHKTTQAASGGVFDPTSSSMNSGVDIKPQVQYRTDVPSPNTSDVVKSDATSVSGSVDTIELYEGSEGESYFVTNRPIEPTYTEDKRHPNWVDITTSSLVYEKRKDGSIIEHVKTGGKHMAKYDVHELHCNDTGKRKLPASSYVGTDIEELSEDSFNENNTPIIFDDKPLVVTLDNTTVHYHEALVDQVNCESGDLVVIKQIDRTLIDTSGFSGSLTEVPITIDSLRTLCTEGSAILPESTPIIVSNTLTDHINDILLRHMGLPIVIEELADWVDIPNLITKDYTKSLYLETVKEINNFLSNHVHFKEVMKDKYNLHQVVVDSYFLYVPFKAEELNLFGYGDVGVVSEKGSPLLYALSSCVLSHEDITVYTMVTKDLKTITISGDKNGYRIKLEE